MKRVIALMCSLAVLCAALVVGMPTAQASVDGMVRVWLKSMNYYGSISSVNITLNGSYSIPSAPEVVLSSRGTYSIEMVGNRLMISGTGINGSVDVGTKFTIKQHKNDDGSIGTISLYNNKYGTRSYRGDMTFDISSGGVRLINRVYIEDYLYGVLAGELSNTFPLETLKAQAVIARSYVYNKMQGNEPNYEINDTSGDQVYKGYNSQNNNIIRAVDETAGVMLKYGSSYVNAYFGASNGGQVELPGNAWSSSSSAGCYVMKDDPYDVRNPSSRSATYTFTSNPASIDQQFYVLIQQKAAEKLGYYPELAAIQSVSLSNPVETDRASRGISRNYQTMNMTVLVQDSWGGGDSDSNIYDPFASSQGSGSVQTVDISLSLHSELKYILFSADSDLRLFSLETQGDYYYLTLARYGHGVGMSQRGAQQMANEGNSYKDIIHFYFNDVSLPTVDFRREELTKYVPMSSTPIAVGTVNTSSLTVRADASSSSAKLGTLEMGATVQVYSNLGEWLMIVYNGSIAYINSAYVTLSDGNGGVFTPPPTQDGGNEAAIGRAKVTLSTASSSLKLRASASSTAAVLTTMPHGTIVDVLKEEGSWTRVRTSGNMVGYASTAYLTKVDEGGNAPTQTNTPTPTPDGGDAAVATGVVTGSTVNVRSGPSSTATKLGQVTKNTEVRIISQSNGFYKIVYGNGTGYISSSYVRVTGQVEPSTPTPTPTPTWTATPTQTPDGSWTTGDAYNNVSTPLMGDPSGSVVYEYLSRNTRLTILSKEGNYYLVRISDGTTGYVDKSAVTIVDNTPTNTPSDVPTQPDTPTPTPDGGTSTQEGRIKLSSSSSSLNLRAAATTSSSIVTTLKHGTTVAVTGESGDWYAINAGGKAGYVMKKYVTFSTNTPDNGGDDNTGKTFPATIKLSSASSTVNVRAGAGTNYSKLGTLKHGAGVNVVASNGDWYKIEYGTGYGYVLKSYVRLTSSGSSGSDSSSGSSGSQSAQTATTTTSVNLRSKGSTSSTKLGTYPKGTKVKVLDKGSSWSKVEVSGKTGYMINTYLKFS